MSTVCEYAIRTGKEDYVLIIRNWLPDVEADRLLVYYQKEVSCIRSEYAPRVMAFRGDDGIDYHNYSGLTNKVYPWDDETRKLRNRIVKESRIYYDSALINRYRDGKDCIGYHSDKEAKGERDSVIGVSLGGERDFYFKEIANPKNIVKIKSRHGDCMIMIGNINTLWKHSVPKRAKAEERISITFRNMTNKCIPYDGHLDCS